MKSSVGSTPSGSTEVAASFMQVALPISMRPFSAMGPEVFRRRKPEPSSSATRTQRVVP